MKTYPILDTVKYQVHKLQGGTIERDLQPYFAIVEQINALAQKYQALPLSELKAIGQSLKTQARSGIPADELMIDAFALIREICHRLLDMRPYDVQLITAIALHHGRISELKTGEGKTLAAVLPVCLHAFYGKGVHVLTFNDYLAKRDAEWMRPVYEFLGLSVGTITEEKSPEERRQAYLADITYGTARQIGFDYLRSFIAYQAEDLVMRELHYVIVDEADALMIDEARHPMVIAGNLSSPAIGGHQLAQLAQELTKEEDFEMDEYGRNLFLTEQGVQKIEERLEIRDLFQESHKELLTSINLALHARMLLHRDVDYIIRDGQILLVDEFTGRIVENRKWPGGLQAALEAKEGLEILSEGTILGSISLQHFIQQYSKIAGMTATAQGGAEEFRDFYGLDVLVIPPNRTNIRVDLPDLVYSHKAAKTEALLQEIRRIHKQGRPLLVGTLTVKESEVLGALLQDSRIPCQILNARNDAQEAEIIAEAGALGAVTISTNMAGRGTDIRLGGSDGRDYKKVAALGGLHVIGTNRHESDRIDDQLRGRAGRQGDPGSSQFIISFEDPLMLRYRLKEILPKNYVDLHQEEAIQSKLVNKRIALAQRTMKAEMNYIRQTLFDYTDFIEKQRLIFLGMRQQILHNKAPVDNIIRPYLLNRIDQLWVVHLNFISQLREGIHFVRLGGQIPIRVFHQQADEHFSVIQFEFDQFSNQLKSKNHTLNPNQLKRPSSTWTYIVNDNPFGNGLSNLLMGNANIGFQVDFLTLPILFFMGLFKKIRRWKKNKKS